MVQVGNETTGGFIGETNVSNMCVLFSAGAAGVKRTIRMSKSSSMWKAHIKEPW